MAQRLLTATLGLPLLVAVVWLGDPWYPLLVAATALGGFWEYCALLQKGGKRPHRLLGSLYALLLVGNAYGAQPYTTLLLTSLVLLSLLWLLGAGDPKERLGDWGLTLGGVLYIPWLLSHYVPLRQFPQGREWVLLALLGTFASDTGAFGAGKLLGRHPLWPSLSPGKTWEGALGGVGSAMVAAAALDALLGLPLTPGGAVLLGLLLSLFAQAGDLVASALKRGVGAKEAGWLLPGHGGLLDRLDSLLFCGVLVYHYVLWLAP